MNVNQIISLVMRLFLRKAISKGIDKGFGMFGQNTAEPTDPEAARLQKSQGQDSAKRAKTAMRAARRIGRM